MRKAREANEIKKIPENLLHEAALERGIAVIKKMQLTPTNHDSLEKTMGCKIRWVSERGAINNAIDKEVMEAYRQTSSSVENIQRVGEDSLLFTKSIFENEKTTLTGMWRISFSKKDLIRSM